MALLDEISGAGAEELRAGPHDARARMRGKPRRRAEEAERHRNGCADEPRRKGEGRWRK